MFLNNLLLANFYKQGKKAKISSVHLGQATEVLTLGPATKNATGEVTVMSAVAEWLCARVKISDMVGNTLLDHCPFIHPWEQMGAKKLLGQLDRYHQGGGGWGWWVEIPLATVPATDTREKLQDLQPMF